MRSLFARIWLSYVLVIALTLGVAMAISFAMAVKRPEDNRQLLPGEFAKPAQTTPERKDGHGLSDRTWEHAYASPDLSVYFVDKNGHLTNHTVAYRPLQGTQELHTSKLLGSDQSSYRMYVRRSNGIVFGLQGYIMQPYLLAVLAFAMSIFGSAFLAQHLTRPIVQLRTGVRAIAAGALETRMRGDLVKRKDELGGLARDFDQMAENLRAQIAAKEELLRDVSHELRSPLARLRVAAGLARRHAAAQNLDTFERIDAEVERIDSMIGQILRFSRLESGPVPARTNVNLTELLAETVEDAKIEAAEVGLSVLLELEASAHVIGDTAMLRSAVENILRNAIRFSPKGSIVTARLRAEHDKVSIEVLDEGPGISKSVVSQIFEPFFRSDTSSGAGLGLAIVKRVVELHGGSVSAANRSGGGFSVKITLPKECARAPQA